MDGIWNFLAPTGAQEENLCPSVCPCTLLIQVARVWEGCWKENRKESRQAGRQIGKQADKQADRLTRKSASRQVQASTHQNFAKKYHCHHLQPESRSVDASRELATSGVNIFPKWNSQNGSMVFL